jgi:hypothetical protein
VDVDAMREYLARKGAHGAATDAGDAGAPAARTRLAWRERRAGAWRAAPGAGDPPEVECTLDARAGTLLDARVTARRRRSAAAGADALRPDALRTRFFADLQAAGVMSPDDVAAALAATAAPALGGASGGGARGARPAWLGGAAEAPAPLQLQLPGERVCRELAYGPLTLHELRGAVAAKLRVRPTELLALLRMPGSVLVQDDEDVARLAPGALLQVTLRQQRKPAPAQTLL